MYLNTLENLKYTILLYGGRDGDDDDDSDEMLR